MTEWTLGLALVHERPLEDWERHVINKMALRYGWQVIGIWVLYPAALVCIVLAAGFASMFASMQPTFFAALLLMALMVGLPVTILATQAWVRRSRGLFGDLKQGVVKCYAGSVGPAFNYDRAFQRLQRDGLAPSIGVDKWNVEVLSVSRRLWLVDGQAVRRWTDAPAAQVAATPAFSAIAAEWLQPVGSTPDAQMLGGQREMSPAERDEVLRHARRMVIRPAPFAIALTAWLLVQSHVTGVVGQVQIILLAMLAATANLALFRSLHQASQLHRDSRTGTLVIMRIEPKTRTDAASVTTGSLPASATATNEAQGETMELLPISRLTWTEDGRPAIWRRIAG